MLLYVGLIHAMKVKELPVPRTENEPELRAAYLPTCPAPPAMAPENDTPLPEPAVTVVTFGVQEATVAQVVEPVCVAL